jgi:hypothetical protein
MHSKSPQHEKKYREITGLKQGEKPAFTDNLYFMFKHQLGTMYLRYFMWNFSGRSSDIQDANWVGLTNAFKELPSELANNEGRNIYFGLPLLLVSLVYFINTKKMKNTFGSLCFCFSSPELP